MKKLIIHVLFLFVITASFGQVLVTGRGPIIQKITGPTGALINPPPTTPQFLSCVVDGITITTSGSYNSYYLPPQIPANGSCTPAAPFVGLGEWTGGNIGAILTYTFSQPVTSVRVSYTAVNIHDVASLTINGTSPIQLQNPCGFTVNGNTVQGCFATGTYGDSSITVKSATPFTTITLTDVSGLSGIVIGNPCNFVFNPTIINLLNSIVNCPKIYLGERCYRATGQSQETPFSVFNNANNGTMNSGCTPATINGVPCTASNVTIEAVTPLPFGCVFNAQGKIVIPVGTLPFNTNNQFFYRFRSVANPCYTSDNFRADFGINDKITIVNKLIQLSGLNPVYNGATNVYTGNQVQTYPTGDCVSTLASTANVTFTETTSPPNPFYTINAAGFVIVRPQYVNNMLATVPALPYGSYILTYRLCAGGSPLFCTAGGISIFYTYPLNKPANTATILETVKIVPNPSNDGVFVVGFDTVLHDGLVEVFNAMGQKMYSQKVNDNRELLLQLDTLPKGNYVLKVSVGGTTINKNIIKL